MSRKRESTISVKEHGLEFVGPAIDGKHLAEELRSLEALAKRDLSTWLNDFVFGLEAAYQNVKGLHHDDWDYAPEDKQGG